MVDALTSTEMVTDHALGKEKKHECQEDRKQEGSNPGTKAPFVLKEPAYADELPSDLPPFSKSPRHPHGGSDRSIPGPLIWMPG